MLIKEWNSGLIRRKSSSSVSLPNDAWQDAMNCLQLGTEIKRRDGSDRWHSHLALGTTFHSRCDANMTGTPTCPGSFQHWDSTLWYLGLGSHDGLGTELITGLPDASSVIFQIGSHLYFAVDGSDGNGFPHNYIIHLTGNPPTYRRAGVPEFLGSYLASSVSLEAVPDAAGLDIGTYKYMFTLAVYDITDTMVSEGGGYNELFYYCSITLTQKSNVHITFSNSLLSGVLMSHITHINIFRSLNTEGIWEDDQLYDDPYKTTPIWPWFRFVGKKAIGATAYEYIDSIPDATLKNVLDTYDTRGWKHLPQLSHAAVSPQGRIFGMMSLYDGRCIFTENAISSNKEITKYYEHYPEGSSYWYDFGMDEQQKTRGLVISPLGDMLILQERRTYRFKNCDPLRMDYLGETHGYPADCVDHIHGCLNIRACSYGADGFLYILGNTGFKAFNGDSFLPKNYIEDFDMPYIENMKTNACFYPGSRFIESGGKAGVDQILLAYSSISKTADPDRCFVLYWYNGKILVTQYNGFKMLSGGMITPISTTLDPVFMVVDVTDTSDWLQVLFYPGVFKDRNSSASASVIEYYFQIKDFAAEDQKYSVNLDSVGIFGANLDKEFELRPLFDGIPRLNRRIVTPNVDAESVTSFLPRDIKKYETSFDDEAYGNTISLIFYTKSLRAPIIESLELNFNLGDKII